MPKSKLDYAEENKIKQFYKVKISTYLQDKKLQEQQKSIKAEKESEKVKKGNELSSQIAEMNNVVHQVNI